MVASLVDRLPIIMKFECLLCEDSNPIPFSFLLKKYTHIELHSSLLFLFAQQNLKFLSPLRHIYVTSTIYYFILLLYYNIVYIVWFGKMCLSSQVNSEHKSLLPPPMNPHHSFDPKLLLCCAWQCHGSFLT